MQAASLSAPTDKQLLQESSASLLETQIRYLKNICNTRKIKKREVLLEDFLFIFRIHFLNSRAFDLMQNVEQIYDLTPNGRKTTKQTAEGVLADFQKTILEK